jgi:transcriptional regulator with XRE-family HTH domain
VTSVRPGTALDEARGIESDLARISQRIREWRKEKGMTLQELAERSGLATSTIQKIETAQMIPSVAVLLKVARGLGRRPAELVHDGADAPDAIFSRADTRRPVGVRGKMWVERLSGDLRGSELETWRVTLHPGVSSGRGSIQYEGEELVVCEAGRVTFALSEDEHVLRPGDSLHFRASIPHRWRNDGDEVARFTVTGTVPPSVRAAVHGRLRRLARS